MSLHLDRRIAVDQGGPLYTPPSPQGGVWGEVLRAPSQRPEEPLRFMAGEGAPPRGGEERGGVRMGWGLGWAGEVEREAGMPSAPRRLGRFGIWL